jgi:hypothetical protein
MKPLYVVFFSGCLVTIGISIVEIFVLQSQRRAFHHEIALLQQDIGDVEGAKKELSRETVAALNSRLEQINRTKDHGELVETAMSGIGAMGSALMLFSALAIAWNSKRRRDTPSY